MSHGLEVTSGIVGIGTNSPSSYNSNGDNLVVVGSGNTGITIAAGTTDDTNIFFADGTSADAAYRGIVRYNHSNDSMQFYTAATERMRIDSDGDIGIGTTSPISGSKLDVTDTDDMTMRVRSTGASSAGIRYQNSNTGTTTSDGLFVGVDASGNTYHHNYENTASIFATNNTERMRIDGSGNVGIGVATPTNYYSGGDNLVVGTGTGEGGITLASTGTDQWNYILFADGTSGDAQYRGQVAYNHSADQLALTASGYVAILTGSGRSEKLRVDSSGNVGIGVTNPSDYNSASDNLVVGSSGDTGITIASGTSSNSMLAFADGTGGTAGYRGRVDYNHADDSMKFNTAATERMRISSTGIVTRPYQPAFHAYGPTSASNAQYIVFQNTTVNTGSHYSTSTGKFTAPVAGVYLLYWSAIGAASNDVYRYYLRVNQSTNLPNTGNDVHFRVDTLATGSEYGTNGSRVQMLSLSASDEVQIYFVSDGGNTTYVGSDYVNFGGYLIG